MSDSSSAIPPAERNDPNAFATESDNIQPEWDRGRWAWATIAGGWLVMFASFGFQSSFGVFQDFYLEQSSASASAISWIGSIQVFLFTSLGLLSGKSVDLGYFRPIMILGSTIYILSLFMLSIAHPDHYYQLFLSQGVGMGIGGGLIYIPSLTVQAHYWRARRALAVGIVLSGSASGGIVFPIMLNHLFNSELGFGWSIRAAGFLVLGCLLLANALMHPRSELTGANRPPTSPNPTLRELFTDVPYVQLMLGAFLSFSGLYFSWFYTQVYAQSQGVSQAFTFYTLTILNAASIPGRILPSLFAPRLGAFNLAIVSGIGIGITIFALFGIHTVAGITAFAILSGFFTGAFISMISVGVTFYAKTPGEVGIRMGVSYVFGATGGLIGTPIDGALLGPDLTWSRALIFSGTVTLMGTAVLTISRQGLAKRKGTVWV